MVTQPQVDVHSIDANGERFITQCTHRARRGATVTGAKLRDLPDALTKFGAKRGLFVTNGRISPSAKREFLDNYQSMKLEFLDGEALEREVLENAALAALWHDGRALCEVANVVRIPVLIRDLRVDVAVQPSAEKLAAPWLTSVGYAVRCERAILGVADFPDYRPPARISPSEGMGLQMQAWKFEVTGAVELAGLPGLVRSLACQLLERASGASLPFLCVLTGRAVLVPRVGRHVNIPIVPAVPQFALVRVDGEVSDERAWLADLGDAWKRQGRIYNAVADETRRYLQRLDLCGSVSLLSRRSAESSVAVRWQEDLFAHMWSESVFAVWEDGLDRLVAETCLPPSGRWRWVDGRWFGAWLRADFGGRFVELPWSDESIFPERAAAIEKAFLEIRRSLTDIGAEVVAPERARHMMALVERDPVPSSEVLFRFVDLERRVDYPSPVDVKGRCVAIDVCWRLVHAAPLDRESLVGQLDGWREGLLGAAVEMGDVTCTMSVEDDVGGVYVVARFQLERLSEACLQKATRCVIGQFVEWLSPALERLEAGLVQSGQPVVRATRDYWRDAYGLMFDEHAAPERQEL